MTEIDRPLEGHEMDLVGDWIVQDGKTVVDVTCQRIDWLIAHRLTKVGNSLKGGGPPRLLVLTIEDYKLRYGGK